MTYLTGEVTVVHDWTKIDFTNFVYSAFRFNDTAAGPTTTINGATITKVVGVTIDSVINENTTTIDEDLILLGNPQPTFSSNIKGAATAEYQSKYSMFIDFNDEQWFNCGNLPSYNSTSITISMWLQPELAHPPATPGDGYAMDTYNAGQGFALVQDRGTPVPGPPGLWSFYIGVGAGITRIDGVTPTEEDSWYHVVGTWNEVTKEMKLYVNGVEDASNTLLPGDSIIDSTQILRLGANTNNSGEYNGLMNNGAIWYDALSAEEVLEVFHGGRPMDLNLHGPKRDSLISWWKLGDDAQWDGTDWHIPDQVGVNNGISDIGTSGAPVPMTYTSRVKDAP
jgi:hypothetical protein